eukprot:gene12952-biopygen6236
MQTTALLGSQLTTMVWFWHSFGQHAKAEHTLHARLCAVIGWSLSLLLHTTLAQEMCGALALVAMVSFTGKATTGTMCTHRRAPSAWWVLTHIYAGDGSRGNVAYTTMEGQLWQGGVSGGWQQCEGTAAYIAIGPGGNMLCANPNDELFSAHQ